MRRLGKTDSEVDAFVEDAVCPVTNVNFDMESLLELVLNGEMNLRTMQLLNDGRRDLRQASPVDIEEGIQDGRDSHYGS